MITVHREYRVSTKPEQYAHVEINPVGQLDVEVMGEQKHYVVDFEHLCFSCHSNGTVIECQKVNAPWKMTLEKADAQELQHLVEDAQEEFEILMRDL